MHKSFGNSLFLQVLHGEDIMTASFQSFDLFSIAEFAFTNFAIYLDRTLPIRAMIRLKRQTAKSAPTLVENNITVITDRYGFRSESI
jgi:hypothetical protein